MTQDRLEDIKRRRASIPGWDEDIEFLVAEVQENQKKVAALHVRLKPVEEIYEKWKDIDQKVLRVYPHPNLLKDIIKEFWQAIKMAGMRK